MLDAPHASTTVRYVERNPVRARLLERAELHPWSSAVAHCGLPTDSLLTPLPDFPLTGPDWITWLREPEEDDVVTALRTHTCTGRPLGTPAFIDQVEAILGHVVRPRKGGPPHKTHRKERKHG